MKSPQGEKHTLVQVQLSAQTWKNKRKEEQMEDFSIFPADGANIQLYERKSNRSRGALYEVVKFISGRNVTSSIPHTHFFLISKIKHTSFSLQCCFPSFCGGHCSTVNVGQK